MNKQEMKTLRAQSLLMGGLFVGCIGAAVFLATQRGFFEGYLREKYSPLPENLRPMADAAAQGQLDAEEFEKLTEPERLALYDHWMEGSDAPPAFARVLVEAAPALYIARAERTLVCGNADQRDRALVFLEAAGSDEAAAALEDVSQWARRRKMPELAAQVDAAAERVRQRAPAAGCASE